MAFWIGVWSATMVLPGVAPGAEQEIKEFSDREYGYSFRYPVGWKLRNLPEGEANPNMRAVVGAPDGSSIMVVVEKVGRRTTKEEFASTEERKAKVETLMSQTIEQIYKSIAESIKAVTMRVSERRDLSNEVGIKFYLATVHEMQAGRQIVVAGIHSFPFGKDYSVNFVMTAFRSAAPTKEHEILIAVFNSLRLVGEKPTDGSYGKEGEGENSLPRGKRN